MRYSIDILKNYTDQIIVVGPEIISDKLVKFTNDIYPGQGPMAGIHSGLKASIYDQNIVLACDTPFINEHIINTLIKNREKSEIIIFETTDNRMHPLTGIYSKSLISYMEENLTEKKNKLISFIKKHHAHIVKIENEQDSKCFFNLNDMSDLKKIEK